MWLSSSLKAAEQTAESGLTSTQLGFRAYSSANHSVTTLDGNHRPTRSGAELRPLSSDDA